MGLWNWIIGEVTSIEELKPVVTDGEAIIADLAAAIKDMKAGNITTSVADVKQIAQDVAAFAAQVETVITGLNPAPAPTPTPVPTPAPAPTPPANVDHKDLRSGPMDRSSKVHGQPANHLKGHGQNDHFK